MRAIQRLAGYSLLIVGICSLLVCAGQAIMVSGVLDESEASNVSISLDSDPAVANGGTQFSIKRESVWDVLWKIARGSVTGGWWSVALIASAGLSVLGIRLIDKGRALGLGPVNPSYAARTDFVFGGFSLGMPTGAYGKLKRIGLLGRLLWGYGKNAGKADAIYETETRVEENDASWKVTLGSRRGFVCWIRAATGFSDKEKWELAMAKAYERLNAKYGQPSAGAEVPTWVTSFGSVRLVASETSVAGFAGSYALAIEAEDVGREPYYVPQSN